MNEQTAGVVSLVTKIDASDIASGLLTDWLVTAMMQASEATGFISAEILPPESPASNQWVLVERFFTADQVVAWQESEVWSTSSVELHKIVAQERVQVSLDNKSSYGSAGVTTAIVTHYREGMGKQYKQWEDKIQRAQAKFPGYRGSYLQPPTTGPLGMWVTLLRFDTPESLDRWFNSPTRQALLQEAEAIVKSTDIRRVSGSFPGWVPVDELTGQGPPNWKTFLLVLLGLYPIVMLEIRFLMPALKVVPSAPANLIGNIISVAATTWLTMPLFIKFFGPWLFHSGKSDMRTELKWVAILFGLFGLEVAALWNLLS